MSNPHKKDEIHIREVWNHNLDNEFALIRNIVDDYPYIAMDTEFPGVVIKPIGTFSTKSELNYLSIRDNVEILKLIQLGLTFSDKNGTLPTCGTDKHCLWQFNFREFNLNEDAYAHESIEILRKSGINFEMNCNMGVDIVRFAELLMSSGVVMNDSIQWLTFHSGYDFGYLVKLLSGRSLPRTLEGFLTLIRIYFPVVYDIKHLMRYRVFLYGGLDKLAEMLNVERVGTSHQAGSDSLLTCWTFFKLSESYFGGSVDGYAGVLFGIDPKN